jgi:ligand-binding SRPBCC domain-containing protein
MHHTYHAEQWLPYPIELVFAFFANPENLPRLMPAWQKARIEEAAFAPPPPRLANRSLPVRSIAAGAGTRLTMSFRPFPFSPIRLPWEAEITEFIWNDHFCDDQLRGPFAYWHHCHSVRAEIRSDNEGTLLRDQVEYELPFGKLGHLVKHLIIARQLRKTFAYRQARTIELLGIMTNRRGNG